MSRRLLIIGYLACLIGHTHAQAKPEKPSLQLQLLLKGDSKTSIYNRELTISFRNVGSVPLNFPEPAQFCSDPRYGFVMVYTKVLRQGNPVSKGVGCNSDYLGIADFLSEAKTWKTIEPGHSYDVTVPVARAAVLSPGGVFEISARYFPPVLSAEQIVLLEQHGIHVVQHEVESKSIKVEVEPMQGPTL